MQRRMMRSITGFAGLLFLIGAAQSPGPDTQPAYAAQQQVSGDIRIWGSPSDAALLKDWAKGFEAVQPGTHIVTTLHGPESTMAGIYTGVADLAFMPREIRLPVENMAFTWVYLHPPTPVEVATASITNEGPGATLGVFVSAKNPLQSLSFKKLAAVLGAGTDVMPAIHQWGDLGLTGAWANKPIHAYGPAVDSVAALFVRRVVLDDNYKWSVDYREVAGGDAAILKALAHDPDGIAFAPLAARNADVKPVALSKEAGGPFVEPTAATVAARTYPLTHAVTMMLNVDPQKPTRPQVKEFLRYILSREGQAAIVRNNAYLPLDAAAVQHQRAVLE